MSTSSENTQPKKGLLTTRILKSLPFASTVQDLYTKTKESNGIIKKGFGLAETYAVTASSPFVSTYTALDSYADTQLEKLESAYGNSLLSKSVGVAAYPIGFTLGLAQFTVDKVVVLASPAIELSYEYADAIVDNLLPAETDETLEEEYAKLSTLQQKNPLRLIKKRATVRSVAHLPVNAYVLSRHVISSGVYVAMGATALTLARVSYTIAVVADAINYVSDVDELLQRPWTVLSSGNLSKVFRNILFLSGKYVNELISEAEYRALLISRYLEQHKLPYNAKVVAFIASQLRAIQHNLEKISGAPANHSHSPQQPKSESESKSAPTFHHRRISASQRMPSIFLGENQFDVRIRELEARRFPSVLGLLWGELAKEGEVEVEVEVVEEISEDGDEDGFKLVKPKHGHHSARYGAAAPRSSSVTPLKNNPYADIAVEDVQYVDGPDAEWETKEEVQEGEGTEKEKRKEVLREFRAELEHREEEREQREEEKEQRKEVLHEFREELEHREEERLLGPWETPKHPIHPHVAEPVPEINPDVLPAADNNPYGKLVDSEDPISMGVSNM